MPGPNAAPEIDTDEVDDCTLALLYLVARVLPGEGGARAWKAFDNETMSRLKAKGLITDPGRRSATVTLSPEAYRRSRDLFFARFAKTSS